MVFHPLEILKFFKNNLIKIILGSLLFTALFVYVTYDPPADSEGNTKVTEIENEDNGFSTEALPANFYFSVEYADGSPYTNNLLVEQYILGTDILKDASIYTNTDLNDLIDQNENKVSVDYNGVSETKILGVSRNEHTHLFELYVNAGDERDNLAVAEYFYRFIIEEKVPFLNNKNLYIFKEPSVIKIDEEFDVLGEEKIETSEQSIIVMIVFGFIVGILMMVFILWVMSLFSMKINYSFSYFLNNNDKFMLVDKFLNNDEKLEKLITISGNSNKYVVIEKPELISQIGINFGQSGSNFIVIDNVNEIDDLDNIDKLIYLLIEGKTSRKWYKKQRNIDELFNVQTQVVQINKK